jgi:hypothetical protein
MPCTSLPVTCRLRFKLAVLPWLGLAPWILAAEKSIPPPVGSDEGQWVFSLAPKSFQKNPMVDQTVLTEMTDDGRKLPVPTAENPAYYVAEAAGLHSEGHGTASDRPPSDAVLSDSLHRALAVNHYLPAGPGHPPTLLVVYFWGAHNNLDKGTDDVGAAVPDVGHKNLLSRAALVGGTKFAAELKKALEQHDRDADTTVNPALDPLKLFIERDFKTRELYEQSLSNCYYVVASAYDYQSVARAQARKLLWRSKMTVDANGVSMTDTLPALVLNAGVFLGRDMPESAAFARRVGQTTGVNLGPLEVKEYLDKAPAPPPAEKKP